MNQAQKLKDSNFFLTFNEQTIPLKEGVLLLDSTQGFQGILELNVFESKILIKALRGNFSIEGNILSSVEITQSVSIVFENQTLSLHKEVQELDTPPVFHRFSQKPVMIDGEQCYLLFDDKIEPLKTYPLDHMEDVGKHFIDLDSPVEMFPIVEKEHSQSLEVVVTEKNVVLHVMYLSLKGNHVWSLGPKGVGSIQLDSLDSSLPFLNISNGSIQCLLDFEAYSLTSHEKVNLNKNYTLKASEHLVIYYKSQSIFLKIAETPPKVLPISALARDRALFMQALLMFLPLAIPIFLIMLIGPSYLVKKEEIKQIAVIYTPPKEKKQEEKKLVAETKLEKPPEPKKPEKKPEEVQAGVKDKNLAEKKNAANTKKQLAAAAQTKVGSVTKPKKQVAHEGMTSNQKNSSPKVTKQAAIPKVSIEENRQSLKSNQEAATIVQSAPPPTPAPAKTFGLKSQGSFAGLIGSSQKAYGGAVTAAQSNSLEGVKSGQVKLDGPNTGGSLRAGVGAVGGVGGDYSGAVSEAGYGAGGLAEKGSLSTASGGSRTVLRGIIDPELVDRLLNEARSQFQYCYQQELQKNSSIKGTVKIAFVIGVNAQVSSVTVTPQQGANWSNTAKACIAAVVRGINFPEPKGGGSAAFDKNFTFSAEAQTF